MLKRLVVRALCFVSRIQLITRAAAVRLLLSSFLAPYSLQLFADALLKVKTFHDEEAKVIGYQFKEGSTSVIRHLRCILPNGIDFSIGTGFSNVERENPPPLGTVITFKYQSLSDEGKPRFPAFLRARKDITWKDVLNNSKQKQLYSNQDKIVDELKEHEEKSKKAGLLFTKSYSSLLLNDPLLFQSPKKPAPVVSPASSTASTKKPVCKYGPSCYRKNEDHMEQFDHTWASLAPLVPAPAPPTPAPVEAPLRLVASGDDSTYAPPQPKKSKKQQVLDDAILALHRPSCSFGAKCYRKNPQHRKDEAHPGDVDWADPSLGATTRAAAVASTTPIIKPTTITDEDADGPEEATNSDNRPVCRFGAPFNIGQKIIVTHNYTGSTCYRTNPDHLKNFRHFWESKPAAAKSKGAVEVLHSPPAGARSNSDEIIIDDTASLEALDDDLAPELDDVLGLPAPANQKKRPNLIVSEDEDEQIAEPTAKRPKCE